MEPVRIKRLLAEFHPRQGADKAALLQHTYEQDGVDFILTCPRWSDE
jgi:hypothetical protein